MSHQCILHPGTLITHFCQTCSDLVCQNCTHKQPHSNSTHIITQITVAANTRKNLYVNFLSKQLNPIRSKAERKIGYLHGMKNQIQKDRKTIEKDIINEFEAINTRLTDKQSIVMITKQTQIKHLQSYVHTFDDLSSAFQSVQQNAQGLLISYKTIDLQLKRMESLRYHLHSNTAIKYELPREFATTLSKISALAQYQARNQFINKIINNYVSTANNKKYNVQAQNSENEKISELVFNSIFKQTVSDQQAKFCAFCSIPFSIDTLNDQCANNRTFKLSCNSTQFNWQAIIPNTIRGTKRHFWHRSPSSFRKRPTLDQHSLVRKPLKKHYWNALLQLQNIKYLQQGTFEQVAAEKDSEQTGFISKIAFVYMLSKIYCISRAQIDTLIGLLETDKGINYHKFKQILNHVTDDYFQFSSMQEQSEKNKPIAPQTMSYWKKI